MYNDDNKVPLSTLILFLHLPIFVLCDVNSYQGRIGKIKAVTQSSQLELVLCDRFNFNQIFWIFSYIYDACYFH